jgi:hypothetical protein
MEVTMTNTDTDPRTLALLIDADSTPPRFAPALLAEITRYGTVGVRRVYTDWTAPALNGWEECLALYAIHPVQQFVPAGGKNAIDGAMMVDAMNLLNTGRISGFLLISSDGDFARLAMLIREQGVAVYGFGERHTPRPFVTTCDRFVYLDALHASPSCPEREQTLGTDEIPVAGRIAARSGSDDDQSGKDTHRTLPLQLRPRPRFLDDAALIMLEEVVCAVADQDGRATLASVVAQISKDMPGFALRTYGFANVAELAEACDFIEVERVGESIEEITVRLLPIHSDAPPPPKAVVVPLKQR